jgi:hypothetical protein
LFPLGDQILGFSGLRSTGFDAARTALGGMSSFLGDNVRTVSRQAARRS